MSTTTTTSTAGLSVRECVALISEGKLDSERLVADCIAVIDASDAALGAWIWLDREHALAQARAMDDQRRRGQPLGQLHGIPVGIKDIIDTSDMPTARGSAIYEGRETAQDAAIIEKLREAGAVILGKTVTTEFAFMHPAKTRNPHNPDYGPGGSSSGSAAAVGAGQVPLAIGTQTNGSVIRPASFCGVYGFKPSCGVISRRGVMQTSETLDQIGLFARDPADISLIADVIKGYDASDPASYLAPRPRMLSGYLADAPIEPNFAWIDLAYSDRYTTAVRDGFAELTDVLGKQVDRIPAPQSFTALPACQKIIHEYEIYRCLEIEREQHAEKLSETVTRVLEGAGLISQASYLEALEIRSAAIDWFDTFFHDYDAILTPAAPTEAPAYGHGTGDPICCSIWTLCGLPCITLPLLAGIANLPIGVQLVGGTNDDERLLRTTRWLLDFLRTEEQATA